MKLLFPSALLIVLLSVVPHVVSAARPAPPYKIWVNHDGTHILTNLSPWHQKGQPFSEKLFRDSVAELGGLGVDAVAFSPGNGSIPWWQSKVSDHWTWYTARTGKKPSDIGRYIMEGGDLVRAFVEECRRHQLAPIISLRLKDEHDIERLDSEYVSRFYFEHQSWRLDPSPRAVFGLRGLNWIYPEVRAERISIIKELAENYDIDGIELDFMRFFPYFDLAATSDIQRRDVMTGFIREVRAILDRTARNGKARHLAIRIPNRVAEYKNIGLDLHLLESEQLVDIINLSPSYVSQVESDLTQVVAAAPKTAVFYELTHASARGPSPSWGQFGDDYPIRVMTDEQIRTATHLAYARGAAGISFFNLQYTRPASRSGTHSIGGSIGREPPYHLFKELREPSQLASYSQHYWIPYWWKTGYHGRQFQLPKTFREGTRHTFSLDLALPRHPAPSARLRIRTAGATPVLSATEPVPYVRGRPSLEWEASLNGVTLSGTRVVDEPYPEPYKGFLGEPGDYAAWDVPASTLREGINQITLELTGAPISPEFKVDIIWIDLAVPASASAP